MPSLVGSEMCIRDRQISCVRTRNLLCARNSLWRAHRRILVCTQQISSVHTKALLRAHRRFHVCTPETSCVHTRSLVCVQSRAGLPPARPSAAHSASSAARASRPAQSASSTTQNRPGCVQCRPVLSERPVLLRAGSVGQSCSRDHSVSSVSQALCISDAQCRLTWLSPTPCMYTHGFTLVYYI